MNHQDDCAHSTPSCQRLRSGRREFSLERQRSGAQAAVFATLFIVSVAWLLIGTPVEKTPPMARAAQATTPVVSAPGR